jgi:GNAT superfamily N-acetyltransferase
VIREINQPDTALAFAAISTLRPAFESAEAFVRAVDDVQRPEGYRLLGAFAAGRPEAVAAAGFRVAHSLAWGRFLYIDDLVTVEQARRRGHGQALLSWLVGEGRRLGCDQLHLDSGVGSERHDAHRLYLNAGLQIAAHHFARRVP